MDVRKVDESAWAELLATTTVDVGGHDLLRFSAVVTLTSDGGFHVPLNEHVEVHVDADAAALLATVCDALARDLGTRISWWDLRREVLKDLGRVLTTPSDYDKTFTGLQQRFDEYTRAAVCVVPIGGVFSSAPRPIQLGEDAWIGHLSRDMEEAIAALARKHGLFGFEFTREAWWTDDFLDAEADGYHAEEISRAEQQEGRWPPLLLALAVDAVGATATQRALDTTYVFLGALVLAASVDETSARSAAPWLIGDAGHHDDTRNPQHGMHGGLGTWPLQVDSIPGRQSRAITEGETPFHQDLDVAELLEDQDSQRLLTTSLKGCGTVEADDAFADAARNVYASTLCPYEIAAHLLRRAAEKLDDLGRTETGDGSAGIDSDDPVKLQRSVREAALRALGPLESFG